MIFQFSELDRFVLSYYARFIDKAKRERTKQTVLDMAARSLTNLDERGISTLEDASRYLSDRGYPDAFLHE